MTTSLTRPCPSCDDGFVHWRTCGHTGACPCRVHEAECEHCIGGLIPCAYCGESPAVAWDQDEGFCDEDRDKARCVHPDDALIEPRPAMKIDGRVVRWSYTCSICRGLRVLDAETGEDASERGADVFHASNGVLAGTAQPNQNRKAV